MKVQERLKGIFNISLLQSEVLVHNISHQVRKEQQGVYFLRKLRQAHFHQHLLINFYRSTTENLLTYCCTVQFSCCTAEDTNDLQWVVGVAKQVSGISPSVTISLRLQQKARRIIKDPSHLGHFLSPSPIPSTRRYRTLRTKKPNRLKHKFYPRCLITLAVKSALPLNIPSELRTLPPTQNN